MRIIHFTHRATDPLKGFGSAAASFRPLAQAQGDTHISCLHIERNGKIQKPSISHSAALLCIHGRITLETPTPQIRIDVHAGMGAIVERHEAYSLSSEEGAILLIVESNELAASERAISTPKRIAGASWPSDSVVRQGGASSGSTKG